MSTLTELFTNIANAIRGKTGGIDQIKAEDFPTAIGEIPTGVEGGIIPTGTKSITENGTYDVTSYASAEVNVSASGITPSGSISITENGTHDVTNYTSAIVNVSQNIRVYTATVPSTLSSGTCTFLTGDDFLKNVYNSSTGFVALWMNDPPTATIGTFFRFGANFVIGTAGSNSYKGTTFRATSASVGGTVQSTNGLGGTNYNGAINMTSAGNIFCYCNSTSVVLAGTYTIIAGTV